MGDSHSGRRNSAKAQVFERMVPGSFMKLVLGLLCKD